MNRHGKSKTWRIVTLAAALCMCVALANAGERGKASWYTGYRLTASGERFSPQSLTAAHKTLPFGTVVRVTRTDTGHSVDGVRINNRGPFIRGRIIDVTPAVADLLYMRKRGVVPVVVEVTQQAPARKQRGR